MRQVWSQSTGRARLGSTSSKNVKLHRGLPQCAGCSEPVECVVTRCEERWAHTGRTVQYKLNAQSLRLFGLHSVVNDAHRAGANRLQNKKQH